MPFSKELFYAALKKKFFFSLLVLSSRTDVSPNAFVSLLIVFLGFSDLPLPSRSGKWQNTNTDGELTRCRHRASLPAPTAR